MQAALEERRDQFTTALRLYQQVPAEHPRGPAAQLGVARCYDRILERLRELGEPSAEWEKAAIAALEPMLPFPATGASPLDVHQSEIAVRLARILLQQQPPNFAAADRLLARVFAGLETPMPAGEAAAASTAETRAALRTQAAQLRVVSLAGQAKPQAARELLDEVSAAGPTELLRILDGLSKVAAVANPASQRELGELQLQAAQNLARRREDLKPADRQRLDECLASAYLATGQPRLALQTYETLLKAAPRSRPLLTSYADVLMRCATKECLQKAQGVWKTLESLSPPGSDDWLVARYHLCQVLLESGDAAASQKLLKVTRLLYPKLGGEALRAKFAELELRAAGDGK
jgi:hypothetical protein